MLHALPIRNVHLHACHEDWQQMTPSAQGRHCASCNRQVVDFTHSTAADLEQARAAAPDGRLCGRFRAGQLAPESRPLRLRLRWFLAALVLVMVQGLSAQQAWAQVSCSRPPFAQPNKAVPLYVLPGQYPVRNPAAATFPQTVYVGMILEPMPEFQGGQAALVHFLKTNLRYPDAATLQGKVFVDFTVQASGRVTDAKVMKGLEPVLDAEVLRVVRLMPSWKPGTQNDRAAAVSYTLPITFIREEASAAPPKRKPSHGAAPRQ
ncbi:energy transducer TonB [Hymenobacter busanensis]|uniref:Energy transducer TonB n=1 Tax=Hymenobacter busanensis TaxID=2607656 RepID=A0A7L4ZY30_9BACT|nr:energy transducer TonB [Hymenobacter busanensis]KAA9333154.1 energy transducer TonB [Hymenobacter busanensis]QHJ08171.1 TonB family protein [Hymenobacter busanensis]